MRKELFLALLPMGVVLGLTGCSNTTPDVADYLKLQCEGNPGMETAHQSVEMIPGQEIYIGNQKFDVTEKGRLRYKQSTYDAIEVGQRNFVVVGDSPYNDQRYLVSLEFPETGNKTKIDVSLNCKNPTEPR